MHFTILIAFFYHHTGHGSDTKAVMTIGIGLACVIPLGKNR